MAMAMAMGNGKLARQQLEWNISVGWATVGFQEFGHHYVELCREGFDGLGFGCQARHVVGTGNSDACLGIPVGTNE